MSTIRNHCYYNYLKIWHHIGEAYLPDGAHKSIQPKPDLTHLSPDDLISVCSQIVFAGYVQQAQMPGKTEPSMKGEIDFNYVFDLLEKSGYDGYMKQ